ncbi:MAG: hypothetical protein ACOYN2_06950 [Patescibacteria group bacterium]
MSEMGIQNISGTPGAAISQRMVSQLFDRVYQDGETVYWVKKQSFYTLVSNIRKSGWKLNVATSTLDATKAAAANLYFAS